MPSSRARKRRAQQHRAAGAPGSGTRSPVTRRAEPISPEQTVIEQTSPAAPPASSDLEPPVEPAELLEAEVLEPVEPDEAETLVDEEDGDADAGQTLEEQEAEVEAAEARIEAGLGQVDDEDLEPAFSPSGNPRAAAVAGSRGQLRSGSRNRRRSAAPRPQGPALVRFFRETFDELRKVDWPTPSELYRYTVIVIVTVIVLAAFIAAVDFGLQKLAEKFIYGSVPGVTG